MKTRQLTMDAVLAAMCAALGSISIDLGNLKFSFESLPVIIGALLFGPVDGVFIGGIGTLIASLASLITFREYTSHVKGKTLSYIGLFSAFNFGFLLILTGLALLII